MPDRPNLIYRYDGSFQGFLCCVAECFRDKHMPQGIELLDEVQSTLFPVKEIDTDLSIARRVGHSIAEKISGEAYRQVKNGFLTCLEEKELRLLRFLLLGYRCGASVMKLSTNNDVHVLEKAVRFLQNEAHFHREFLRFSDYDGVLVSIITPKNTVLPLIAPHFCDRLSGERFVIYDKTHCMGFLWEPSGKREFFQADGLSVPQPGEDEKKYRELWKTFYKAIAVEGRMNFDLRRNRMPKRYWPNMTEFQ